MLCHPSQSPFSLPLSLYLSVSSSLPSCHAHIVWLGALLSICLSVKLSVTSICFNRWKNPAPFHILNRRLFQNVFLFCFVFSLLLLSCYASVVLVNGCCWGVAELSSLEISSQSNCVLGCVASFVLWFPIHKVWVSLCGILFFVCSTLVGVIAHYSNLFLLVFSFSCLLQTNVVAIDENE